MLGDRVPGWFLLFHASLASFGSLLAGSVSVCRRFWLAKLPVLAARAPCWRWSFVLVFYAVL
jgi:hypothetical protein